MGKTAGEEHRRGREGQEHRRGREGEGHRRGREGQEHVGDLKDWLKDGYLVGIMS